MPAAVVPAIPRAGGRARRPCLESGGRRGLRPCLCCIEGGARGSRVGGSKGRLGSTVQIALPPRCRRACGTALAAERKTPCLRCRREGAQKAPPGSRCVRLSVLCVVGLLKRVSCQVCVPFEDET